MPKQDRPDKGTVPVFEAMTVAAPQVSGLAVGAATHHLKELNGFVSKIWHVVRNKGQLVMDALCGQTTSVGFLRETLNVWRKVYYLFCGCKYITSLRSHQTKNKLFLN